MYEPSRRPEPGDPRRRRLIRAAATLVARGGVRSVEAGAIEDLADAGDGSVAELFGGLAELLFETVSTLAGPPAFAPPAAPDGVQTADTTLRSLADAFESYVEEDQVRFSALVQFSAASVFGERQYLAPIAEHHRRTREGVSAQLAILHRGGTTGVATADLTPIAGLFADSVRGIEMCYLLDRDSELRAAGYRALVETVGRRLVNDPRAETANARPRPPIVFEPDYRMQLVLEPDGSVRDLLVMDGVRGWNARDFLGRPVDLLAAALRRDPSQSAVWRERLAEVRRQPGVRTYRESTPGGEPSRTDAVTTLIPIHDARGALESIAVAIEDRSGQRVARSVSVEQEEQLRNAVELTRLGTYIVYLREPVIVANERFAEIYGRDPQQVMDEGGVDAYLNLIHAEDRPIVTAALEASMSGEIDYVANYRLWIETPDGPELRWISGLGRVEVDADGPIRVLGVIEDVTERHKQQEAILQSQKRDAIGTLAAGVAHDFNNVLSAILGNATSAERRLAAGESATESLGEITRGARRGSDLVQRLLSVSRDDHVPRAPYSVAAVIQEACALIRPTLGMGTQLRESLADDLPGVVGDASGLHQVLLNLIVNADDAIGSRRGTIEVEADTRQLLHSRPGKAPGGPAGAYVRIRVRDNGPGLSEDVVDRAFDSFFSTKSGRGAGLGLAAARTVIEADGGSITLESVFGLGTVFTVLLPAVAETPSGADDRSAEPATSRRWRAPRVLLVDDEPALTTLADREMAAAGCDVVTERDPFAALDRLREHPDAYDAVITDLAMPGLNGLGFVRHLRKALPAIPVVLTSGYISDDARDEARRLGIGRIVPKPCTLDDLANAVLELVDEQAAGRATGS